MPSEQQFVYFVLAVHFICFKHILFKVKRTQKKIGCSLKCDIALSKKVCLYFLPMLSTKKKVHYHLNDLYFIMMVFIDHLNDLYFIMMVFIDHLNELYFIMMVFIDHLNELFFIMMVFIDHLNELYFIMMVFIDHLNELFFHHDGFYRSPK